MKRTKLFGILFIFTILTIGVSTVEAQIARIKTWKITVSQSGGFAGINKSYTLDQRGNLNRKNKKRITFEKIENFKIREIGSLIKELRLPGTGLKTVKGDRIYDGIYSGFVINIDGRDFSVGGNSFYDAKYLALSRKQKATLAELKAKLDELNGFLDDSTINKDN